MGIKGKIIVLVVSLIIYLLITVIYNKIIVKNDYHEMYILTRDVKSGDIIDKSIVSTVKYKNKSKIEEISFDILGQNLVFAEDYSAGSIITKDCLISNEDYLACSDEKEIVAVKIDVSEDNLCSSISVGDKVNVFASARSSELLSVINVENVESYSNNLDTGVSTVKLLEDIEIKKCYDMEGNSINNSGKIETVMFEVNKDMAIKIANLKNYCTFSLSLNK